MPIMQEIPGDVAAALLGVEGESAAGVVEAAAGKLPKGWGLGLRRGALRLVGPEGQTWSGEALGKALEAAAPAGEAK